MQCERKRMDRARNRTVDKNVCALLEDKMTIRILAAILLSVPMFAGPPANQLEIFDTSGSSQSSRPVRFGRMYHQGDVWHAPKPSVAGQAITEWQSTVKTRWRDGSASCDITGATNEMPITITCANHGFRNGDLVKVSGVAGNTAANGTWKVIRRSRNQFFLRGSAGNGGYSSGGTATGPGPGSVKHAITVFNLPTLAADGSVRVTMIDSGGDHCHLGSKATCEAAALTGVQMLGWDSSGWGASIELTQGTKQIANARTMVNAGDYEYWIMGPVLTEVTVRDHSPSRTYDLGWECQSLCTAPGPYDFTSSGGLLNISTDTFTIAGHGFQNGTRIKFFDYWKYAKSLTGLGYTCWVVNRTADTFQCSATQGGAAADITAYAGASGWYLYHDYSSSTWSTSATHRSFSPAFVLSFYSALSSSVRVEYIGEIVWKDHLQDQRYDLALKSASDLSVTEYAKTGFNHFAKTRWRKVYWDGTEPGAVNIDHGESYLEYSGAIPVFADDVTIDSVEATVMLGLAGNSEVDLGEDGNYTRAFGTTGGRPELGLFPRWTSTYLQTFHEGLWQVVWDQSNVAGHIPIHYRESNAAGETIYFVDVDGNGTTLNDADDNVAGNEAHGRTISLDARRSLFINSLTVCSGCAESYDGWSVDMAHQHSAIYVPYLLSGELYFLEELYFWAGRNQLAADPGPGKWHRGHQYGLMSDGHQVRGVGRPFRHLGRAALMAPDGTVEQEYFMNKIENQLMEWEGRGKLHFQGDHFIQLIGNPENDPCAGFNYSGVEWVDKNPFCYSDYHLKSGALAFNPLGVPTWQIENIHSSGDMVNIDAAHQQWERSLWHAGVGHLREMGLKADPLMRYWSRFVFAYFHPDHNPYLGVKRWSPTEIEGGGFPRSVLQHRDVWNATGQAYGATNIDPIENCWEDGYYFNFRSALTFFQHYPVPHSNFQMAWAWWTDQNNIPNAEHRSAGACESGDYNQVVWNHAPRFDATRVKQVQTGASQVLLRYVAPTQSQCTISIDDDEQFSSPVISANDGGGARERQFLGSGLQNGREYYFRITCEDEPLGYPPATGSALTGGTIEATMFFLRVNPASVPSVTDVLVRYGAPATSLDENTGEIPCVSGCTVSLPASRREAMSYQVDYLTNGQVLHSSQIETVIP